MAESCGYELIVSAENNANQLEHDILLARKHLASIFGARRTCLLVS